jgi:hypothetical protein
MKVPYVHSNYDRIEGDYYPTIDNRCVYGFLEYFSPTSCVDVCSPCGSGIIDTLVERGIKAYGIGDAFTEEEIYAEWIVTNPPYKKGLVDSIINRCIRRTMDGEVEGVAILLRSNFDHAKSRWGMFAGCKYYYGQIKLLFRPWWSEVHTKSPIHNYIWHIWTQNYNGYPVVHYAPIPKNKKNSR